MASDRDYLLSLQAVREQSKKVLAIAQRNGLNHFEFDASRMDAVADYVIGVIDASILPAAASAVLHHTIPPHGRWQHFDLGRPGRIESLIDSWRSKGTNDLEITRRLIDLFFVSVLLDAGAGDFWRFVEPETDITLSRSEGIAVASLHMFVDGAFASEAAEQGEQADGTGLSELSEKSFNKHFQITDDNPMIGVASRVNLLRNVGSALLKHPEVFGQEGRPGNIVDYLTKSAGDGKELEYETLWRSLQQLLIPSWPGNRTVYNGEPIGDAWPLAVLGANDSTTNDKSAIHPFHKLTQWLAYSLTVPFQRILGYTWKNLDLGTGLPEYRNGGLFVDLGVLKLKDEVAAASKKDEQGLPVFDASTDVVVEWRAMTVALLDDLHRIISGRYKAKGVTLSIPQMLEAGTWKSGRELAAERRPKTKSSPIIVISDGTLY
ncbi:hypothetical protein S40293_01646 [Stachybotrys chartarum IBT 40293]|nr:hypothetical protein S40293_01646 [Stachybotrys chartarum IBT 40293]